MEVRERCGWVLRNGNTIRITPGPVDDRLKAASDRALARWIEEGWVPDVRSAVEVVRDSVRAYRQVTGRQPPSVRYCIEEHAYATYLPRCPWCPPFPKHAHE